MRLIQRPWLFAFALCAVVSLVLGSTGCKDDEAAESAESAESAEADEEADEADPSWL